MEKLFRPLVNLLNNFKYQKKLALLNILVIVVAIILTYQLTTVSLQNINFSRKELLGMMYLKPLMQVLNASQQYREFNNAYLNGDASAKDKASTAAGKVDQAFQNLASVNDKLGTTLDGTQSLQTLQTEWTNIKNTTLQLPAQQAFAKNNNFINNIESFIVHISDTSNLTLDPDVDTYYLMDTYVVKLPSFLEQVAQLRDTSFNIASMKQFNTQDTEQLNVLKILIQSHTLPGIKTNLEKVLIATPSLTTQLQTPTEILLTNTNKLMKQLATLSTGSFKGPSSNEFFQQSQVVVDNGNSLLTMVDTSLTDAIQLRVNKELSKLHFNLSVAIISMVILLLLFIGIYFSIIQSIRALVTGANKLATGDLSSQIMLTTKDELQEVTTSFNKVRDMISNIISETQVVVDTAIIGDLTQRINLKDKLGFAKTLADAVNKLNRNNETVIEEIKLAITNINMAAKEIASGNSDLSRRTEEQAAALEQTLASIQELMAAVKQNSNNAERANKLALSSSDVALKGGEMVTNVVTTMNHINEDSQKVSEISSMIDGIAFQTNILALNAAVEAARAGEQGRGFAVVANEVRNLAQRSATAAKEIKTLISTIVEKISNGTKLVGETGSTMQEIVTSVQQVTTIVSDISTASLQQSTGIEQVNQTIAQMEEVTQQNAALVEEAAAAAEALETQTQRMEDVVKRFKLNDHIPATPKKEEIQPIKINPHPSPVFSNSKKTPKNKQPNVAKTIHDPTKTEEWQEF